MNEKQKSFVYKYWNRTELGREMIASSSVSDSDLLFLIPNNVKKMNGLSVTRITSKRKRKNKNQRKKHILSFKFLDLLEKIVGRTVVSTWSQNVFDKFVNVKNFTIDDKFEPFCKNESISKQKQECSKHGSGLCCSNYYLIGGSFDD